MDGQFHLSPGPGNVLYRIHISGPHNPPTIHLYALLKDNMLGIGVFQTDEIISFPLYVLPHGVMLIARPNLQEGIDAVKIMAEYLLTTAPPHMKNQTIFFKCRKTWFFVDDMHRLGRVLQDDILIDPLSYELLT